MSVETQLSKEKKRSPAAASHSLMMAKQTECIARQTLEPVFACKHVAPVQITKEHVNNNGTKNAEINTTSIILNDFAATKWEVFALQMPLRRCSLISLYLLLVPRVYFCRCTVLCLSLCYVCFVLDRENHSFFHPAHPFVLIIIFHEHCILDRCKLKFLVPNVVNIKAVLSTRVLSFFSLPMIQTNSKLLNYWANAM